MKRLTLWLLLTTYSFFMWLLIVKLVQRLMIVAVCCASPFVLGEESAGGVGANGEPGTPAVAPTVQSQQPQPHPFEMAVPEKAKEVPLVADAALPSTGSGDSSVTQVRQLKPGMLPLEVVAILGMDATVEYAAPLLTMTYWSAGEWVAVVFLDSKLISVQRGRTK